jgi:alkanesulfonate monooxygenase SsuD/methylene tetrahydromethanopterin reductase-like flavin-dependent oxidoreductase (luciferase family)
VTFLTLAYDMRAPAFGAPQEVLYRAALEQSAWADWHGFTSVILHEHHSTLDGYLPSPIVLASALAAVSDRLLLQVSLIPLPLHHPLRLAEDLAVLDLISGGRLRLMVGLGYRDEEYRYFGVKRKQRVPLFEEAVAVLRQAWTGEPFGFRGEQVRVLPRPVQRPCPQIIMGGASPASARRAARIADGYQPVASRLYEIYLEELTLLGKAEPTLDVPAKRGSESYVHVAVDPDRAWHRIAPHALYDVAAYAEWIGDRPGTALRVAGADELRSTGRYRVVTTDECVDLARSSQALIFKPLLGGLDPDIGWESLELFAAEVLPRLASDTVH